MNTKSPQQLGMKEGLLNKRRQINNLKEDRNQGFDTMDFEPRCRSIKQLRSTFLASLPENSSVWSIGLFVCVVEHCFCTIAYCLCIVNVRLHIAVGS